MRRISKETHVKAIVGIREDLAGDIKALEHLDIPKSDEDKLREIYKTADEYLRLSEVSLKLALSAYVERFEKNPKGRDCPRPDRVL